MPVSLRNTPYSSKCYQAGSTGKSYKYILTAECVVDTIELFGNPSLTVSTASAANAIICIDLLVAFVMWILLVILKPIMQVTEQEIDDNTIMPPDFTVILTCHKTNTSLDALPALYWSWA